MRYIEQCHTPSKLGVAEVTAFEELASRGQVIIGGVRQRCSGCNLVGGCLLAFVSEETTDWEGHTQSLLLPMGCIWKTITTGKAARHSDSQVGILLY